MNYSNDNIGNRTRDLACSAVPQPIATPRAPFRKVLDIIQV